MAGYVTLDTAVCGSCQHFRQHYIKQGKYYVPISYGHCVYPRLKKRTVGESCPMWKGRK